MPMRTGERKVITTVFLCLAALVAISTIQGQQIPFVPNGLHFPNAGGASQTYSTTGKGIDLAGTLFSEPGE
jgi:hypothetical protein